MGSCVGCCSAHQGSTPLFLAVLTAACAVCGLGGYFAATHAQSALALALYAVAYLAGGWGPLREVARAVAQRQIDVNFLMVLAALGAASIGQMGEGVALLFLFSLSGTLEKYTLERTARSIESLVKLRPDQATVVRGGVEVRVPLEQVLPGELVRIVPSERLGVDGVIAEGSSALDESTLTGESIPVEKGAGEEVFAGTLNHRGTLLVKVTRTSSETMLAKIVRMVAEARDEKTGAERHVERWQKPYVIGVLLGAALCTALPYFFMAHAFRDAFYHGMTFLVAASPCAVVISAPAAVLAALTRAALNGVLFKGGAYLERFSTIRALALDKTGTLTRGEPEVVALYETSGSSEGLNRLLAFAASVEKHSEHALGQAVLAEAARRKIPLDGIVQFESHVGLGVHALVNGTWVGVGREQLFESHHLPLPESVAAKARELRAQGMTALMVVCSDGCAGVLGIADRTREEAAGALARLRGLGIRFVSVLTGDHAVVGEALAAQAGADESRCGLRPGEKVAELKRIKDAHGAVAFVGDGVNDAPALAAADIGIAMGGAGTDAALETADVVLMRDDLRGLVFAYWLSRRTRAAIRRGLTIAFGVIAFLVASTILNILGLTDSFPPLWVAVLCHEGSTVLTIFSGLYLLIEPEPPAPAAAALVPGALARPAAAAG
ncbi:MAG: heavy metal translocating P-type ATPase [Planctomycetes bacterium]|nr:heavy metal translocating P-type ATPase [Planctomycetota bacterium]